MREFYRRRSEREQLTTVGVNQIVEEVVCQWRLGVTPVKTVFPTKPSLPDASLRSLGFWTALRRSIFSV